MPAFELVKRKLCKTSPNIKHVSTMVDADKTNHLSRLFESTVLAFL